MVLMYSKHHFPLLPSPRAHLFHQQHYGRDAKPEKWTEGGASFGTLGNNNNNIIDCVANSSDTKQTNKKPLLSSLPSLPKKKSKPKQKTKNPTTTKTKNNQQQA